jgi:leucine-rich repeat protein SHOC2
LTQLPDAQLGWPQLQRLVLSDNDLPALPPSIGSSMQLLRHLALDGNRLTSLPAEVGQLAKLEVLLLQVRGVCAGCSGGGQAALFLTAPPPPH